jgi:hypothetical protein
MFSQTEQLINIALTYQKSGLRMGQSLFNALYEIDGELANKIRGTNDDCFHDDSKILRFLIVVVGNI